MNENLKVGAKVFLKPTGNYARYKMNIEEGEIVSIKKKYFYVKIFRKELPFDIKTNRYYVDNSGYDCHFSLQEIQDELELFVLNDELRKYFDYVPKLSLVQLRQIKKIIIGEKE